MSKKRGALLITPLVRRLISPPRRLASVRRWLRDEVMRRAPGNIGDLASGSAIAVGLQFVTLILAARTLGPPWWRSRRRRWSAICPATRRVAVLRG